MAEWLILSIVLISGSAMVVLLAEILKELKDINKSLLLVRKSLWKGP